MCGSLSAEFHYRVEFPAEKPKKWLLKTGCCSKEAVETPAPAAKVETPAEKATKLRK